MRPRRLPSLLMAEELRIVPGDAEREVLSQAPTQRTQPKGIDPKTGKAYESVEIPVPTRDTLDRLLHRAENTLPGKSH